MARSKDTMNRPDSTMLNSGASPTAAAQAFEKAVAGKSETPAIATSFVPPVLAKEDEKKSSSAPSPFKQIKNAAGTDAEKDVPKKDAPPAIASGFIPMPGFAKKEEINPFKSNKAPVKRPVNASINHAVAADEVAEDVIPEEEHKANERMSFTAALAGQERQSTFKPTELIPKEKIDPFKHNVDASGDKKEDEKNAKPAFAPASESRKQQPQFYSSDDNNGQGGVLSNLFKKK